MSEVIFELKGVRKWYEEKHQAIGSPTLGGVSCLIQKGERVALVGPSGSGKTTLLGLLNARLVAEEGEVFLFGEKVQSGGSRQFRKTRARIAWIPQDLGLVGNLRVIQNVVMGRAGKRSLWGFGRDVLFPSEEVIERVFSILKRVGIEEKLYERTDTLSGGQQQRVAIARALFQEAEVILADEPVSAVDPGRARDLIGLLDHLSKEDQSTLVMSIHQVDLAQEFFPRLLGLKDGALLIDGMAKGADLERLYEVTGEKGEKEAGG